MHWSFLAAGRSWSGLRRAPAIAHDPACRRPPLPSLTRTAYVRWAEARLVRLTAWAKPDARLICGDCEEEMEAEQTTAAGDD
jgi:hypothetical protein